MFGCFLKRLTYSQWRWEDPRPWALNLLLGLFFFVCFYLEHYVYMCSYYAGPALRKNGTPDLTKPKQHWMSQEFENSLIEALTSPFPRVTTWHWPWASLSLRKLVFCAYMSMRVQSRYSCSPCLTGRCRVNQWVIVVCRSRHSLSQPTCVIRCLVRFRMRAKGVWVSSLPLLKHLQKGSLCDFLT